MYTNSRIHSESFVNHYWIIFFLLCLSMLSTTPIADINTSKLVEPAEMNGSGRPVGGIEPVNTSCCTMNLSKKRANYCSLFCSLLLSNSFTRLENFSLQNLYVIESLFCNILKLTNRSLICALIISTYSKSSFL